MEVSDNEGHSGERNIKRKLAFHTKEEFQAMKISTSAIEDKRKLKVKNDKPSTISYQDYLHLAS